MEVKLVLETQVDCDREVEEHQEDAEETQDHHDPDQNADSGIGPLDLCTSRIFSLSLGPGP
jgi:hypothetical protein